LEKKYSKRIVDDLIEDLNQFALRNEFIFINARYDEKIVQNNLIDIKINFDKLDKNFVERINILGNFITDEKVIRNTLIIDEGDPYNEILFDKSIQNLKAKNIFKSVSYKTENINSSNKKIIDIKVEEKPTGEIFAGAGTGTTGTSLTAGIKENNYLGLGITLDTNFTITDDSLKGKFSVLNPNYKNSDKSVKTSIENTSNDFMSSSGYKTNRVGFTLGTEFEQMTDFYVNIETLNFYEDLETSSNQ
jgi:outer membrane protein insertion porin family